MIGASILERMQCLAGKYLPGIGAPQTPSGPQFRGTWRQSRGRLMPEACPQWDKPEKGPISRDPEPT